MTDSKRDLEPYFAWHWRTTRWLRFFAIRPMVWSVAIAVLTWAVFQRDRLWEGPIFGNSSLESTGHFLGTTLLVLLLIPLGLVHYLRAAWGARRADGGEQLTFKRGTLAIGLLCLDLHFGAVRWTAEKLRPALVYCGEADGREGPMNIYLRADGTWRFRRAPALWAQGKYARSGEILELEGVHDVTHLETRYFKEGSRLVTDSENALVRQRFAEGCWQRPAR